MFGSARRVVALYFGFLLVPTLAPSADRNPDSMVRIAAGDFFMGSDSGPEDERPRHKIYLGDFLSSQSVTNGQSPNFSTASELKARAGKNITM
jgi:formylglycine-generating enzyme required for sulfatase activity